MKKREFIKRVAERYNEYSDTFLSLTNATVFYDSMMDVMIEMIGEEDKIPFQGIGTLEGLTKKPHIYYNMVKKEKLMAPAKKSMKFTPSDTLIKLLNSDEE